MRTLIILLGLVLGCLTLALFAVGMVGAFFGSIVWMCWLLGLIANAIVQGFCSGGIC